MWAIVERITRSHGAYQITDFGFSNCHQLSLRCSFAKIHSAFRGNGLLITKAEGEEKEGRAEMGLFSNRVERSDIVAGDHIYTWRALLIFAHHGIYIGDGLVIHFTAPSGKLTASSPSSSTSFSSSAPGLGPQRTCPNHSSQKPEGGVAVTCLDCFIKEGSLYRYGYGVRFRLRGGTSTAAQSDPASTVLRRANYLLENGFGNYHLVSNNCEDFASYCKTGILVQGVGNSGQVASFLGLPPLGGLMTNFLRRVGTAKVPVEEVNKKNKGACGDHGRVPSS